MNITMILFGFFPSDVRVRKEANTLVNANHRLKVVCCEEEESVSLYKKIQIPRIGKVSDWKGKMTPVQLLKFWILSFRFLLTNPNFHVLHCHDLTGLPPAVWYKIIFPRTKIVYDSHEMYPDAVSEKLGKMIGLPFLLLEKFCLHFVDKLIGISMPQKKLMTNRYKISNFLFLPNFPTQKEFEYHYTPRNEKVTIIYSGGIHKNRGYEQLIQAVKLLNQKRMDFKVQFLGGGPYHNTVQKMVDENKINEYIEFIGAVHYTKVKDYLNKADIGIALYQPTTNCDYGLSNKIFEYILCGLPLIYPYYKGSTEFLLKVKGIPVNPTSSSDIANKIDYLIENSKVRKSIQEAELKLAPEVTWESIESKLLTLYKEIAKEIL